MATLSARVIELAQHGYDFTLIATTLGITPKEVVEVLENQAHELSGGGGSGVPRDGKGRAILPGLYAALVVEHGVGNFSAEGYAVALGLGSFGHQEFAPLELVTMAFAVPAGANIHNGIQINAPGLVGPLAEIEFMVSNLDGTQQLGAVAENLDIPEPEGPSTFKPSSSDFATFGQVGEDISMHEGAEDHAEMVTTAGGTFFIKVVIQQPAS